jgi:hypothetical protein
VSMADKQIAPDTKRRADREEWRGGYESGARPATEFPTPSTGVKPPASTEPDKK